MDFQNQSAVFDKKEIDEINLLIKDNLSKANTIRVVNTRKVPKTLILLRSC